MLIVVCDDHQVFLNKIKEYLDNVEYFKNSEYVFCGSGEELLACFEGKKVDFVFLDVDLPGISGLDAGKRINEISPRTIIIFVSNYPQYAIDAFDCNATSYLLKGFDEQRFGKTVEKAISKYKTLNSSLCLKTGNGIVNLFPDEIYYVEYLRKYCIYHTENNAYSVRCALQEALEELAVFGFYQTYQCYLINLSRVKSINTSSVILEDGTELPLRRGSSKELIKEYSAFMKRRV